MNNTRVIAIDLAKNVFQVPVINRHGQELLNKSMRRKALAAKTGFVQTAFILSACARPAQRSQLTQPESPLT